jgi:hypothetical protein
VAVRKLVDADNNASVGGAVPSSSPSNSNPAPTSSYDTRVDWILLPPVEDCRGQNLPFDVTTTPRGVGDENEEGGGYKVCPTISDRLSGHNLVLTDLLFSLR